MNIKCQNCSAEIEYDLKKQGHSVECESCGAENRIKLKEKVVPGNLINDYLLTDFIGAGAMGQVFKAQHLLMKKEVAIKVIRVKDGDDQNKLTDQFITELQTSAQLEHPNIVTVTDAGVCDGVVYLVMQYLEGIDLSDHIKSLGFMKEKQAMVIVSELVEALDYAWEEYGMIHRDLKPENIRITSRGEVKLMDFGLAKIIDANNPSSHDEDDEEHFHIVGTPDFISPEQALDKPNLDCRADIYSLGYLLMYMLTGKRVFSNEDPMVVVKQHLGEHPKPLDEYNPDIKVSDATLGLLTKMVKKDRDKRIVSWKVLAKEINDLLVGDIRAREEAAATEQTASSKGPKKKVASLKVATQSNQANTSIAEKRRERRAKKKKKGGCLKGCLIVFFILFISFLVAVMAIVAAVKGAIEKTKLPEELKPVIEHVEKLLEGKVSSDSEETSDEEKSEEPKS